MTQCWGGTQKVLTGLLAAVAAWGSLGCLGGGGVSDCPQSKNGRCCGTPVPGNIPRELDMSAHPMYVVEPPDTVFVDVRGLDPEYPLNGDRKVWPDGTIDLGYYGSVSVEGMTLEEIENKLNTYLASFVSKGKPHAIVTLTSSESKSYYVLGAVTAPGRYPVNGKETVLDAIMAAGGLSRSASKEGIKLVRPAPACSGVRTVYCVNYCAIIENGDTRTNFQVFPGDRIIVPHTAHSSFSLPIPGLGG